MSFSCVRILSDFNIWTRILNKLECANDDDRQELGDGGIFPLIFFVFTQPFALRHCYYVRAIDRSVRRSMAMAMEIGNNGTQVPQQDEGISCVLLDDFGLLHRLNNWRQQ